MHILVNTCTICYVNDLEADPDSIVIMPDEWRVYVVEKLKHVDFDHSRKFSD